MGKILRLLHGIAAGLCAGIITSSVFAESGVTPKEIVIGSSHALSGPTAQPCSLMSRGAQAYFNKVNAAGGVNGRTIKYVVIDDAMAVPRAVSNTQRLLQQDETFAIFQSCGTSVAS